MAFKSLLETSVQGAMDILGQEDGLASNQTYIVTSASVYDPATRRNSAAETPTTNVPMVLAGLNQNEMENEDTREIMGKAIIAALDLPGIDPKETDLIEIGAGSNFPAGRYTIMKIKGVPGKSLYICYVKLQGTA